MLLQFAWSYLPHRYSHYVNCLVNYTSFLKSLQQQCIHSQPNRATNSQMPSLLLVYPSLIYIIYLMLPQSFVNTFLLCGGGGVNFSSVSHMCTSCNTLLALRAVVSCQWPATRNFLLSYIWLSCMTFFTQNDPQNAFKSYDLQARLHFYIWSTVFFGL